VEDVQASGAGGRGTQRRRAGDWEREGSQGYSAPGCDGELCVGARGFDVVFSDGDLAEAIEGEGDYVFGGEWYFFEVFYDAVGEFIVSIWSDLREGVPIE